MEKNASEKILDGSLLSKLIDPGYFILFSAFSLYWDAFTYLISNKGLLNLTYTIGDNIPLGRTIVLIASFSLLASVISPFIFWLARRIFWNFWLLLPDKLQINIGESDKTWSERFTNSVSKNTLRLWAIKTNNSLALSLATDNENKEDELFKNASQPFLLALCIFGNYSLAKEGLIRAAETSLPNEFQCYFGYGLFSLIIMLIYIAYSSIPDWAGYFYLPGFKEHIKQSTGDTDSGRPWN